METVQDFEDMLELLHKHDVKYLIIGGLAFIYHARPRYTKDMDLWVEDSEENIQRANRALTEFGSPTMLATNDPTQIVQIGVAPDRIDLLVNVGRLDFARAWDNRVASRYGNQEAFWIDLDSLIEIKQNIESPKHQEDARVLMEVRKLKQNGKK